METIASQSLWSLLSESKEAETASCSRIRKDPGHEVRSYLELATKVAELQFRNRDFVLLFRGQTHDHHNKQGYTSLKPKLFRSGKGPKKLPPDDELEKRFSLLLEAERKLVREYARRGFLGVDRLRRHQILRWAILQ